MQSIIDVTLTKGLSLDIKNWRVSRDFNGSDHNNIHFELDAKPQELEEIRCWESVDWIQFGELMNQKRLFQPKIINEKKLDKMVDSLYEAINKSLDKVSPKIKASGKGNSFSWYTNEHELMSKNVNKLYIRAMRTRNSDDWVCYKICLLYTSPSPRD